MLSFSYILIRPEMEMLTDWLIAEEPREVLIPGGRGETFD